MARVTVEDCIEIIPNRFELVVTAAQRAKQIAAGAPLTVDRDNDKNAVVALREIADQTIDIAALKEEIIASNQSRHAPEEFEAVPFAGEIEEHYAAGFAAAQSQAMMLRGDDEDDALDADLSDDEDEDDEAVLAGGGDLPDDLDFADEEIDPED